jgi:hypothetical protein
MPSPYYHFDGVSDYVNCGDVADDLGNGNYSVHYRCRQEIGNYVNIYNTEQYVVSKQDSSPNYYGWRFGFNNGVIRYSIHGTGAAVEHNESIDYRDGKIHDYIFTLNFDRSVVKVYVDGVLISTRSMSTAGVVNPAQSTIIGASYTGTSQEFLGDIYNTKFYNVELTADEVKELYSGASVPWKYKGASQANQFSNPTMIDADGNGLAEGVNANKANCSIVTGNGFTGNAQRAEYNTSQTGIQGIYVPTSCPAGKVTRVSFKYRSNYSMSLHNGSYHFGPHFPVNTGDAAEFSFDFIHTGVGGENIYVSSWLYLAGEWFEISDLSVTQVGTVAEYDGSSATELVWFDKSSNGLDGTVTGATLENKEADLYIDGFAHIGISDTSHHISSVKSKLTVYTVGDTTWPETNYRNVGTSAGDNKGFSVGIGKLAGDQTGYIWQGEDDDIEFWTNDKKRMILTSGGELVVTGSAPQIKLVDSDAHADDFWLHANSDSFYVLTDRNNDGDFADANVAVWNSANSTCTIDGTIDTTVTAEVDCVTAPEWAPPLILTNANRNALLYGQKLPKMFVQTSQPAQAESLPGDLWWDSDGYTMYVAGYITSTFVAWYTT